MPPVAPSRDPHSKTRLPGPGLRRQPCPLPVRSPGRWAAQAPEPAQRPADTAPPPPPLPAEPRDPPRRARPSWPCRPAERLAPRSRPSPLHMLRLSGAVHQSQLGLPPPARAAHRCGLTPVLTQRRQRGRAAMKRSRRRLSAASRRRPRRSHCHRLARRKWGCARPADFAGRAKGASGGSAAEALVCDRVTRLEPRGPPSRKWASRVFQCLEIPGVGS